MGMTAVQLIRGCVLFCQIAGQPWDTRKGSLFALDPANTARGCSCLLPSNDRVVPHQPHQTFTRANDRHAARLPDARRDRWYRTHADHKRRIILHGVKPYCLLSMRTRLFKRKVTKSLCLRLYYHDTCRL